MSNPGAEDRRRPAGPSAAGQDATARAGGWDAPFASFYREWTKPLVGFLVVQGASVALAADLVQESMTALYRRWPEITHPRAWMFRAVSRQLVRALSTVQELPTDEPASPSPLLRARATDIECWEQQHDLAALLSGLPPRQRQVMAWSLYGYTPADIAEQLDLPDTTVRSHLYRARNSLKARLSHEKTGGEQ